MTPREASSENPGKQIFEQEIAELLHNQIFFTESVFVRLPMGIEIYDANGILRSINEHASRLYGVDIESVINKINLFDSPYVDKALWHKYVQVRTSYWNSSTILI